MIFVFGGAYQGKLDYALELFKNRKTEKDTDKGTEHTENKEYTEHIEYIENTDSVFTCTGMEIDFSKEIIYKLEDFCRACCENGTEAKDYLIEHESELAEKIVISADVSQGLVPMDPVDREYREMMGRMMIYISSQASEVYRVFAGLGQRLK